MKFDFDDMNLIPQYSEVDSRAVDCDTEFKLNNIKFKNNIIPANMESVINTDLAIKLAQDGYFYIMHRFDIDVIEFMKTMINLDLYTSISIGVNQDSYDILRQIQENEITPNFITVDIAHGHCKKMKMMLNYLKKNFEYSFIIAGNVGSVEATKDLDEWGADAIKIGIGPGTACTTAKMTGFGTRHAQPFFIKQCSEITDKIIIADGGVKEPCDIVKSVVVGADMVMVGSMFSTCIDSPAPIIIKDNIKYKQYHGSASSLQSNKTNNIEGTVKLIPCKDETQIQCMARLNEALQSSISYAGGFKLMDLRKVKYVI